MRKFFYFLFDQMRKNVISFSINVEWIMMSFFFIVEGNKCG